MLENEATISAIKETAKEITLLLGGTNLILVATITWLSKIWMDRILENERRKTQFIVEQLKNSLTQEREKLNSVLKTQLDQSRYFFEKTVSFFSENQKSIHEKRLLSFEQIWKAIQKFRQLAPFLLDFLLEEEYKLIKTTPNLKAFVQGYAENELFRQCKLIDSEIESHRIYIPALIWQLYYSYRLISIRPMLKYKLILTSDTLVIPWYKEPTLHAIIVNLLDEKELEEFDGLQMGKLSWILNCIEIKLLDTFQKYLSGDILLADMNEKAILLDQANRKAQEASYSFERDLNTNDIGNT
jgi:hypothetical protein